jgi:putative hydrolase of the HAD superfamily
MKVVFFDADDTLWDIQNHYNDAMKDMAKLMTDRFNISVCQALERIEESNIATTKELGCTRHSFPTAIVRAFVSIANINDALITSNDILEIYRAADNIHDQIPELKPGVETTISTLNRNGYICKIITLGDQVTQSAKIYRSGIWEYIKETIIVPEKNVDTYVDIANKYNGPYIMIGNSMHSDINPALKAGWYAIHIPADTWSLDNAELVDCEEGKFHRVGNIKEVIEIVESIYGGAERM